MTIWGFLKYGFPKTPNHWSAHRQWPILDDLGIPNFRQKNIIYSTHIYIYRVHTYTYIEYIYIIQYVYIYILHTYIQYIYIYVHYLFIANCINRTTVSPSRCLGIVFIHDVLPRQRYLVGGWPTPLKNDGVRQWGWDYPVYDGKK